MHQRVPDVREAGLEEDRHRFVEIEDDRDPDELERQRGEHEEVRQRRDLDEPEAMAPVRPHGVPGRPEPEPDVLAQVRREAGALVALDVDPVDAHAVELAVGRFVELAQADDEDRAAGRDERLGLAADPRVLLVVAVDDEQDRSDAARHRPVDHPAPRRRTCRSRTAWPRALSTVSTTRSAWS